MLPLELLPKQLRQRAKEKGRKGGDREGRMKITVGGGLANNFAIKVTTRQNNEENVVAELKTC